MIVSPVSVLQDHTVPVPERFSVQLPKFRVLVLPFDDANTPTECVNPALSVNPSRCSVPNVNVRVRVAPRDMASRKKMGAEFVSQVMPPQVVSPPIVTFNCAVVEAGDKKRVPVQVAAAPFWNFTTLVEAVRPATRMLNVPDRMPV